MKKNRNRALKLLMSLALTVSTAVLAWGGGAWAAPTGTTPNFQLTPDYAHPTYFKQVTSGKTPAIFFDGANSAYDASVISKSALSTGDSVELGLFSNTGGYADYLITLGHSSANEAGPSTPSNQSVTIRRYPGHFDFVGRNDLTIYGADGTTTAAGNFAKIAIEDWMSGKVVLHKFVLKADSIEMYYDFEDATSPLTTLRNVIKKTDGSALGDTAEGTVVITPIIDSAETGKERRVDALKLNGTAENIGAFGAGWQIVGDASKCVAANKLQLWDAESNIIPSKFRFSDQGLQDGDTVFDITFTSSRLGVAASEPEWGLLFGLSDTESTHLSDGAGWIKFSRLNIEVHKGNGTVASKVAKATGDGADATGVYNTRADIAIRAIGKKGGTLELYRQIEQEAITTLHSTYTGLNFNGHIAFMTQKGANQDSGSKESVSYKSIDIKGNVEYTATDITINSAILANLEVGSEVILDSKVTVFPSANVAVSYSITEGTDICNLNPTTNKLTVTGSGDITVKAWVTNDPAVFDEYSFNVREKMFEYSIVKEDFAMLNPADWTLEDSGNKITVDGSLQITDDFKTTGTKQAALVSNLMFSQTKESDEIFDITFTSAALSKPLSESNNWGLIFGMKTKGARAGDSGVGYLKVTHKDTGVYLGTEKIAPSYKSGRTSEASDIYFFGSDSLTLRAVGKKDGTLELYRGYVGSIYSGSTDNDEYTSKLFATYSGLDFNGYVAFTTDSTRAEGATTGFQVGITDVYMNGFVEIDDNYSINNVVIDQAVLRDAIVSAVPIKISAKVNAIPNLKAHTAYTMSVVTGNAEITADGLIIKGAGDITIRAQSVKDPTVSAEFTFSAIVLTITDIKVDNKLFEGITNDSQPIKLKAVIDSNSVAAKHQDVIWTVISGPAEVVGQQLRITGQGEVKLRVQSKYVEGSYKDITFTVGDADSDMKVVGRDKDYTAAIVIGISAAAVVIIGGVAALVVLRKKKK